MDGDAVGPSGLTGEDADRDIFLQMQEESLMPIKEDLSKWLVELLGIEITAEKFMSSLDNGVAFCKLSNILHDKAVEKGTQVTTARIKYKPTATSGSWFARDNTATFLQWCRAWGVVEQCLFESEDMVNHTQERSVVACLLELARSAGRLGLPVPGLVSLEREIEQEQTASTPSSTPRSTPSRKRRATGPRLDEEPLVQKVASTCKCSPKFPIQRIKEGIYTIGGRRVFIRLLYDRHLMVRVGGGWVELSAYLRRHDPCRVVKHSRNGQTPRPHIPSRSAAGAGGDAFLFIKGRYTSNGKTPAKSVAATPAK